MPTYARSRFRRRGRSLGPLAFKGFTPYRPPPPPTGSYDPALDAQQRAAQRGLGDLEQDTATGNLRAGVDLGLGREDLIRQRDRGYFDLDRGLSRGTEDYNRDIMLLGRSYQQLGRRQAEGARAAGVLSGGIAMQAAAKRAENQAIERAPIDTGFNRLQEDTSLARSRLGEDTDLGLGALELGYQRDMGDRGTGLFRAQRENTQFGLDIGEQKAFQAAQSGYVPPGMPKGMGVNRKGVPYQERREGPFMVRYDQHGNVLSRRRRRGYRPVGTVRPSGIGIG